MAVDTTPRSKETRQSDPANVDDHPFVPRDEWWSLCKVCGLARAAHEEVSPEAIEAERQSHIAYYGDDNPDIFD